MDDLDFLLLGAMDEDPGMLNQESVRLGDSESWLREKFSEFDRPKEWTGVKVLGEG